MPYFGNKSKRNLKTCDRRLRKIFNEVIKHVDCTVLEGHRSQERQDKLYDEGKTKVKFPNGRHNKYLSLAVDVTPFAGVVIGIARSMGIKLRWGGDWDQDFLVQDNSFDDFPHFEIRE